MTDQKNTPHKTAWKPCQWNSFLKTPQCHSKQDWSCVEPHSDRFGQSQCKMHKLFWQKNLVLYGMVSVAPRPVRWQRHGDLSRDTITAIRRFIVWILTLLLLLCHVTRFSLFLVFQRLGIIRLRGNKTSKCTVAVLRPERKGTKLDIPKRMRCALIIALFPMAIFLSKWCHAVGPEKKEAESDWISPWMPFDAHRKFPDFNSLTVYYYHIIEQFVNPCPAFPQPRQRRIWQLDVQPSSCRTKFPLILLNRSHPRVPSLPAHHPETSRLNPGPTCQNFGGRGEAIPTTGKKPIHERGKQISVGFPSLFMETDH